MKKTLQLALIFSILYGQNNFAMQEYQMPPAQVSVALAEERLLAPTVSVTGSVISLNDSNLSTQVSGELQWLAEVGTQVKKGDIIAKIVQTLLAIDVQVAEAQLKKIQADFNFRDQEVMRFKLLANRDNTSKARLQEESSKRTMLLQEIQAAKANLTMAHHYLSQTEIRAPFSGHIVSRLANKGEFLSEGDKLLRLVDTFNREVSVNAPMNLLHYLNKDALVEVEFAGTKLSLPIKTIVPVGDKISRMVEVRIGVSSEEMIIGLPVKVSLPSAEALTRVVIPRDSLIIRGSEVYIYRINQSMKTEKINAEIDTIAGTWVAIKSNLDIGDKIVIRGGERLMPDQDVQILEQ
ncbi:MAG: efflux RND transporter periplasmic adaptor subunit [Gammaproteobacteria bacterium]|nr:efflux RND transporter periplasmic adaptor subunit [Gammaproteobacteria bacterium]